MIYPIPIVAHAPHAPGRQIRVAQLLTELGKQPGPGAEVIASRGPEHASIWARRLWERAAEIGGHVLLLNDDVSVPDVGHIQRAVAALPDEPISLCCTNPNALAVEGAWARCYHYSGPGVVLPPGAAESLLAFVYALPWSFLSRVNEDVVANMWAWSRQRPFWYLLPSPVRHDTSIPSTLGYDAHPHRDAVVVGEERDPAVPDRDAVPFVELDWSVTPGMRYRREVLRAGRQLCALCVGREGIVGSRDVMLCAPCLAELASAGIRR